MTQPREGFAEVLERDARQGLWQSWFFEVGDAEHRVPVGGKKRREETIGETALRAPDEKNCRPPGGGIGGRGELANKAVHSQRSWLLDKRQHRSALKLCGGRGVPI